jgi:putative heme-binding domain-containing protein
MRARAEKLLRSATADRQVVLEQYQPALEKSATADPLKGKQLFEKNCVTCHKIGTLGINVGPDIGDTRDKTPAYLLTAILDPNRAVDNNYFGYTAVTVQGKVYTGLIVAETTDSITIRQPEGKQETLLRDDLDEIKSSGLSLMPVGLEKTLNVDQLAELISFLKNWRYLDGEVPARAGP